jgi:hypothetical protein
MKILSPIQFLTVLGLILEFSSFMIFTWEFLKGWIDHITEGSMSQTRWKKIRRNAQWGVALLLLGLILQGVTVFI